MGASSSTCSSSTTTNYGRNYDVFLSFRGEDNTSDSFKSHLCSALSQKHVETFVDGDKVRREDETSPVLLKAIKESKISVVIFSKDYASSKGCLRELAEIIKYKKMNKQIVIPVFYQVNPSDVRKQTGSFKDAFANLKQAVSGEELRTWREALTEASNLSGWDSSVTRPESRLVDEIVKDVLKKLNDMFASTDFRGLVAIDSRIEKVKSLLCMETFDFRVVGIWGMGGIGKTTIAGAVFNQISSQFDGNCRCFVANVREESENCGGLVHLRDKVLSQILGENINLGTPNIPSIVKRRLQSKKVIIVLDDVTSLKQLEILAGGLDGFGPGSRVIITTRDKQLLLNFVAAYNIYEVEALDKREALQLFCNCAFKEDHVPKDFMVFAQRTVDYAKGNPLALKVLGSSLYRKSKQDWESALHKLNKISKPEIHNILRIGYDALDREEKNIFLDIACFFKGEYKYHVMELLNGCYSAAQAGVSVLVDKSLITISTSNINMHDLLQEMGWEIVRQESFNTPGERSRLHGHEDVCQVLRRSSGTEAVKGLLLDMSKIKDIDLSSQAFENMCNLRFLKLYDWTRSAAECVNISKVHLPYGLNYFPDKLRYFHWRGYPSKVLPSKLSLDHLVELDLFDSNVEQLWESEQHVPRLKRLLLGHSQQLTRIPDLSGSPYLEVIDLVDCRSLLDISSSIQHLKNLNYLRLEGCKGLRSFSRDIHFESLQNLDLSSCINFMEFPQISGIIRTLSLNGSEIEEVPSSVESLTNLITLDVSDCSRLKHISIKICKVKSLRFLFLKNCSKLECFPEILETLEHLETLDLSGTAIKELPLSIEHLKGLLKLFLRGCKNLETLPNSISTLASLIEFDLSDCSKLDKLPVNMGNLKSLENLSEGSVVESQLPSSTTSLITLIECLAFRPSSGLSFSLKDLCLNNCNLTEIPEDIGCLSSLKTLELCRNDFESLPTSIKQLSKLEKLLLNDCNMLRSVTVLPVNLFDFEAMNCKELQSLPNTSEFAEFITSERNTWRNIDHATLNFVFTNSPKLNEKAFSNVFAESLQIIKQMAMARKKHQKVVRVNICYPGSKIPEWFCYQSHRSSVNIQPSPLNCSNRKFLGLALCAVIAFEGYCYTGEFSVGVPYVCYFQTDSGDRVTYKGELTFRADRNYKDSIFINSDHIILGYHQYLPGKLSMDDVASFKVVFKAPEDSSPRIPLKGFSKIENLFRGVDTSQSCRLKYCGVSPIYAEPEIIQTSISDEKSDSTNQDLVPDPQTIPEKKLTLFINNKVAPFYRILSHKVGLWLFYCWIFLACLFCGLCVFGMLVFLVLQLSTRCETYLSSHVRNTWGKQFLATPSQLLILLFRL
ncbi:hypothetical protein Ddye_031778 [Dipteronia dyeriana]|uniref:ADP-ribosyl cyclase/cyclic ADP-ribose hydrolase n=1 Tax=Dipteronia dyeriana TaxID=168575 RepID=A0AAD9TJ75_9ROSI|nr:hypothetical protein Ddye_031778 [Dipteronia dyeriana]